MGNKVNTLGFRLGINKRHSVNWFANSKADYQINLVSDLAARKLINAKCRGAGITEILIERSVNKVSIILSVARPGVVIGRAGAGIESLKKDLKKIFKEELDIRVLETKNSDIAAAVIANNIADMCVKRMAPKMIIQKELEKLKAVSLVKGAKIQVAGRIKGSEIARTEKLGYGSIPRQSIRSNIDYAFTEAQVPNAGKHGIKVWIYLGEKIGMEDTI